MGGCAVEGVGVEGVDVRGEELQGVFGGDHGGARGAAGEVPAAEEFEVAQPRRALEASSGERRRAQEVEVVSHEKDHPGVDQALQQRGAFDVVVGAGEGLADVVQQGRGEERGVVGVASGVLKHLQGVVEGVALGMIPPVLGDAIEGAEEVEAFVEHGRSRGGIGARSPRRALTPTGGGAFATDARQARCGGGARSTRAGDGGSCRGTMRRISVCLLAMTLSACEASTARFFTTTDVPATFDEASATDAGAQDVSAVEDRPVPADVVVAPRDVTLLPDAACSAAAAEAPVVRQPVDIIWVVDNSVSMAPAVREVTAGLNRFASLVGDRGLDYRVVMLSLRSPTPEITVNGGQRYAVCIPPPLAGNGQCGNGPRFLHAAVDIRSTQPLEQLLGTLAQTEGYQMGRERGGEPWREFLRPNATKSIVVVTDDNARMSADIFENFEGGRNPYSGSFTLPPGLLHPTWNGQFTGYVFHGIYGWLSEAMPNRACTYPSGGTPPNAGIVYNELVRRTRGARARICDGASAWAPFFERVATAVEESARIACDLAVPDAPAGNVLDPERVNVVLRGESRVTLGRVGGASACGSSGGWYFDDPRNPRRVFLCPSSCERAQTELRGEGRGVEVLFGCLSIPG